MKAEDNREGGLTKRSTLILLRSAIANGWELPNATMRAIPAYAASILSDTNSSQRERLRAAELLAMLQRDTIAALATLDKIERLENGDATERIELQPITLRPRVITDKEIEQQ